MHRRADVPEPVILPTIIVPSDGTCSCRGRGDLIGVTSLFTIDKDLRSHALRSSSCVYDGQISHA